MGKLLYTLFKRQFLKYYFLEQSNKSGFEKMKKVFVDSDGRQYFTPENDFDIPHERTKEIEKKLMRIASGLSDGELNKFFDAMEKALGNGKKPDIAQIGFLIKEMRLRQEILLHPDLMFDMVALKYIREDEDPCIVNVDIHKEKIEQFKKDSKDGLYDFFYGAGLSTYIPYLTKLESEWEEYWRESEIKIKAMNQHLQAYTTGLTS